MSEFKPLIIITGGSSGVGAEIAKQFSEAGFSLGLLARYLKAMEELCLPRTICIETDVTNPDVFKTAVAKAEKKFGPY